MDQQTVLDRYRNGVAQGSNAYTKGVQGYNGDPALDAATPQAMQDWLNGVQQSYSSGKRQASLQKAAGKWKQNAVKYGGPAFSAASGKAADKYAAKLPALMNLWEQQRQAAKAVQGPKGNEATIQAKVMSVIRLAKAAKGTI